MQERLVSIIVPNWNGRPFLGPCLDAVFRQNYGNLEVIVVDCNSADESVPFIRNNYPQVRLIALEIDRGGPYADNLACSMCKGDYILLLNNDVIIPSDCLSKMVLELEKDENCVINPVQLGWDGKYISSGFPHPWLGYYLHKFIKREGKTAFYPSLACCLVTKRLLQANPLNENFFLYEDTEWGWRLHLKEIRVKVMSDLCFYHKDAGTIGGSPKQAFINGRTAIATTFICFKLRSFLLFSPLLFLDYVLRCAGYRKSPPLLKAYLRGLVDFFRKIRLFNTDRRKVQRERLVGDWEIIKLIAASVDFERKAKERWFSNNAGKREETVNASHY